MESIDQLFYCNRSQRASRLKVRLGEFDIAGEQEPLEHEEIEVAQIVVHPQVPKRDPHRRYERQT